LIVLYPASSAADLDAVRQDRQRLAALGGRGQRRHQRLARRTRLGENPPLLSCDKSRPAALVPTLRAYLDARFNLTKAA
jgi:hypothetical protein